MATTVGNLSGRNSSLFSKKMGYWKSPPYSLHCNPLKRTNKIVKNVIAEYVSKYYKKWNKCIQKLEFAYNTTKSSMTGYTPGSSHQRVGP